MEQFRRSGLAKFTRSDLRAERANINERLPDTIPLSMENPGSKRKQSAVSDEALNHPTPTNGISCNAAFKIPGDTKRSTVNGQRIWKSAD